MSQAVQPYRQPEATPVGHSGTRVDIRERPAWAISGWVGVARRRRLHRRCRAARRIGVDRRADRGRCADLDLTRDRPAGAYQGRPVLRQLRRHDPTYRPVVDRSAGRPAEPEHPGQELRDQPPEGQRRRRQPGRDRRDRRVAGGRHLARGLRRRRLRQLRAGAGRVGPASRRDHPSL